jgi:hypothetical protein
MALSNEFLKRLERARTVHEVRVIWRDARERGFSSNGRLAYCAAATAGRLLLMAEEDRAPHDPGSSIAEPNGDILAVERETGMAEPLAVILPCVYREVVGVGSPTASAAMSGAAPE